MSSMVTSSSKPGTAIRARRERRAWPTQPVSRRYQVRTYTCPPAHTTHIGTHRRRLPSERLTAIRSSPAAFRSRTSSGDHEAVMVETLLGELYLKENIFLHHFGNDMPRT